MVAAQSLAPGTVLGGDYEIERPLAAGGMGAVYVARQRSTQKLRAIKTMLPDLVSDPSMRSRFTREATVAALIESDHVVEVLAAGVDEATNTPWLAMELLAGDDLSKTMKRGDALDAPRLIELIKQFGHALAAAHRAGVVHRDLKPENIFLSTPRREGVPFTVKVLDFGIAKLMHGVGTRATTSIIGSPLWMAPEQTDIASAITPSTDVWTLALIVFWLLTGKHYWLTPNSAEATLPAMMRELVVNALPPASERAATLGASGRIPPGFDAWFARCVVREPERRYRDASEAVPPLLAVVGVVSQAAPRAAPVYIEGLRATNLSLPATTALSLAEIAAHVPQDVPGPAFAPAAMGPMNPSAAMPYPNVTQWQAPSPSRSTPARSGRKSAALIAAGVVLTALTGLGVWAFISARTTDAPNAQPASASIALTTAPGPEQPKQPVVTAPPATPPAQVAVAEDPHAHRSIAPSHASHSHPAAPTTPGFPPFVVQPAQQPAPQPEPQFAPQPPPSRPTPSAEPRMCDIEAGPLWSNAQAQSDCVGVCQRAQAQRFTGQWHTTRPGEMSVCQCAFPAGTGCP